MLSLDLGAELSTPGSTLELGAAGMLQVCSNLQATSPVRQA